MIESVLKLSLSMAIINGAVWCVRTYLAYSNLKRLESIESHTCNCLRYANLLFYHALENECAAVDEAEAGRRGNSFATGLVTPNIGALSLFGERLEYTRFSGEIRPYYRVMQALHEESRLITNQLLDAIEESGQQVDSDFLNWDYGSPHPDVFTGNLERYKQTMNLYSFATMQSKYLTLFTAVREGIIVSRRQFVNGLSLIQLIPVFHKWIEARCSLPSRDGLFEESSKLESRYQELRDRTGDSNHDHLIKR